MAPAAGTEAIVRAVQEAGFRVTAADLAVRTGIPARELEEGLTQLVRNTKSRLLVDNDGNIAYEFDRSLKDRTAPVSLSDHILALASRFFYLVRVLFKLVMVSLFLGFAVLYTVPVAVVVGVVGTIGTVIVFLFSGDGDGATVVAELLTSEVGIVILSLIVLGIAIYKTGRALGTIAKFLVRLGRPSSETARASGRGAGAERLMERLYRFAVGPTLPARAPPRGEDAVVLERVRRRGGYLLASDLVRWQGLGLREADEEATRLLVEHHGEPVAVDPGVVAFSFPNLSVTAEGPPKIEDTSEKTRFEEMETPRDLTANSRRTDFFITVVLVALVGGGAVALAFSPYTWMAVALGWVPFSFAGTTLLLPLLRWPFFLLLNRGVRLRNAERVFAARFFKQLEPGRRIKADRLADDVLESLTRWTHDQPESIDEGMFADSTDADEARTALAEVSEYEAGRLTRSLAARVVERGFKRLGGEPDIERGRNDAWCFPEIARLMEAERALKANPPARLASVGAPVFDTDSREV